MMFFVCIAEVEEYEVLTIPADSGGRWLFDRSYELRPTVKYIAETESRIAALVERVLASFVTLHLFGRLFPCGQSLC
jgi:hypothetical protein